VKNRYFLQNVTAKNKVTIENEIIGTVVVFEFLHLPSREVKTIEINSSPGRLRLCKRYAEGYRDQRPYRVWDDKKGVGFSTGEKIRRGTHHKNPQRQNA
jgi:hypothetical protein